MEKTFQAQLPECLVAMWFPFQNSYGNYNVWVSPGATSGQELFLCANSAFLSHFGTTLIISPVHIPHTTFVVVSYVVTTMQPQKGFA